MRRVMRLAALCLALLLMMSAGIASAEAGEGPVMEVHQMMLGCADGYLVRLGDVNILIDGGEANPRKPEGGVVAYLTGAGVTHLDAVIITHWHLDHCMELNNVLAAFGSEDTVVYSPAERVPDAIDNGTVVVAVGPLVTGVHRQLTAGDVVELGGMTFSVIGPDVLTMGGGCNHDSLNFVLQYGSRRFLFTGDFAQGKGISHQYTELCREVDVLKFPHHGLQPYEITTMSLRVVRPQVVLVPGVANKYKVWDYADDAGVKFSRDNVYTSADGNVVILTDGGELFEVRTQQNPADYAGQ